MLEALRCADIAPLGDRWMVAERVTIESEQQAPGEAKLYAGKVEGKPCELLVDADGLIKRGKCLCGHHQKAGIRMGPCRHLLALRSAAMQGESGQEESVTRWYDRLQRWTRN